MTRKDGVHASEIFSRLLCVACHFSISTSGFVFSIYYPSYETNLLRTAISVAVYWVVAGAVIMAYSRLLVRDAGPTASSTTSPADTV